MFTIVVILKKKFWKIYFITVVFELMGFFKQLHHLTAFPTGVRVLQSHFDLPCDLVLSCVRHRLGFLQIRHAATEWDPGFPKSLVPPQYRQTPLLGGSDHQPSRLLFFTEATETCSVLFTWSGFQTWLYDLQHNLDQKNNNKCLQWNQSSFSGEVQNISTFS